MHSLFHYCHHYYYPGCHCHLSELLWKPANCRLHYPPSAKVKLKSNYTLKTYIQFVIIVVHSLSHVWLCDPIDCSKPGFPVLHHLLEFAQTHVHWVSDAIQPSHPLSPPSPSALNLSQHQGLFQWVSSSHQVAKVLELQLQHQSFQWIQGWFPLGLIGFISLQSKGLSRVFSNNILQKHLFFGA